MQLSLDLGSDSRFGFVYTLGARALGDSASTLTPTHTEEAGIVPRVTTLDSMQGVK